MMRNLMLTLAYDGADFHGWQHQPELRTVQGCLEQALRRVVRHQVMVVGCSRTDAGVHAAGYVANFYTTTPAPNLAIYRSVGSRLPKDLTLMHLAEVPLTFHATKSAVSKLYRYRLHAVRGRPCEVLAQRSTYHVWTPLDEDAMRVAADVLIGTYDFSSFASTGNVRESNIRTVRRIEIYRHGEELRFDIEGDGFLYKQVRNMVGTLIEIGRGHWPTERMREILDAKDRSKAGPTAPSRGLCLQWVRYDIPNLPPPSADLLERAARARPPAGAECADVESRERTVAPSLTDDGLDEEPAA